MAVLSNVGRVRIGKEAENSSDRKSFSLSKQYDAD